MIIMLTALLQLLHPTSPSRDRDRQAAKRLRRCSSLPERTVSRAHWAQPQSNVRHTRRTRSGHAHTSTSSKLPLILAAL